MWDSNTGWLPRPFATDSCNTAPEPEPLLLAPSSRASNSCHHTANSMPTGIHNRNYWSLVNSAMAADCGIQARIRAAVAECAVARR